MNVLYNFLINCFKEFINFIKINSECNEQRAKIQSSSYYLVLDLSIKFSYSRTRRCYYLSIFIEKMCLQAIYLKDFHSENHPSKIKMKFISELSN